MAIKPLNTHYSMENHATVYDEEALTALELAARTTGKVNEAVEAFNAHEERTNKHLQQQDAAIPVKVDEAVLGHINNGDFTAAINLFLGNLESRVDNLTSQYNVGSTTGDAELLDMRVGSDGKVYASAGEAIRSYLNAGGLIDSSNYATKLPDADNLRTATAYIMHFANGETNFPAHLPYGEKWHGRIALLISVVGTYVRHVFIDDHGIYTRNSSAVGYWTPWVALSKPTYFIDQGDVGDSGNFGSILKALKTFNKDVRFIVKSGVYDVALEYANVYGANYFDNYAGYNGTTDEQNRGLFLGDGVELIGEGRVELVFNYTGSNANVKQYFSVLNTSQNNVVENIAITIGDNSCRYHIHDDFATAGGTNIFKNVLCTGHSQLATAIGGGFGVKNAYVVENCVFRDVQKGIAIAYHNNAGDGKNKLTISGCDCDGSIFVKHYGVSVQKSVAEVCNTHASKIVLTHGDYDNYPNRNVELNAWCNDLDSDNDMKKYGFDLATTETRRPVITFIFDDGLANDRQIVDVFEKNGYTCGFALVSTMATDQRCAEYLEYQRRGFSVLSHSMNGDPMSGDLPNANYLMLESKKALVNAGFNVNGWVTPSSVLNDNYLRFARMHYDYAFTRYWNEDTETGNPEHMKHDDMHKMHRRYLGTNLTNLKTITDNAIVAGGCLVFYYHSRDLGNDLSIETIDALLQHIRAYESNGLVHVLPPNEGIPYYFRARQSDIRELKGV